MGSGTLGRRVRTTPPGPTKSHEKVVIGGVDCGTGSGRPYPDQVGRDGDETRLWEDPGEGYPFLFFFLSPWTSYTL